MVNQQNTRIAKILAPISVAGGATATCTELDTVLNGVKADYAEIYVFTGLVGANGVATLKIQETDTSGSGQADVSGGGFTALVDADDGIFLKAQIDLRKRKRYLSMVITNGATNASVLCAFAILGRLGEMPDTNTKRGVQELLTI